MAYLTSNQQFSHLTSTGELYLFFCRFPSLIFVLYSCVCCFCCIFSYNSICMSWVLRVYHMFVELSWFGSNLNSITYAQHPGVPCSMSIGTHQTIQSSPRFYSKHPCLCNARKSVVFLDAELYSCVPLWGCWSSCRGSFFAGGFIWTSSEVYATLLHSYIYDWHVTALHHKETESHLLPACTNIHMNIICGSSINHTHTACVPQNMRTSLHKTHFAVYTQRLT